MCDPVLGRPQNLDRRLLLALSRVFGGICINKNSIPANEKGGKRARPRRRRPKKLRVTLSLAAGQLIRRPHALSGVKPCTRDLGPTSIEPTTHGGSACPPGPTDPARKTCGTAAGRTDTARGGRG